MMHLALQQLHPVLGYDLHQPWPPGSPTISPAPVPVFAAHVLAGTVPGTQKFAPTVMSMGGSIMCHGTDVGLLIAHFGVPSVILPAEMLLSSSKSFFSCGTIQMKDNSGAANTMGAAVLGVTNANLDCGTPLPAPFGNVIAVGTVAGGMTIGDFLRGALDMGLDMLLGFIFNKLGSAGSALAGRISQRVGARFAATRAGAWLSAAAAREGSMLARAAAAPGAIDGFVSRYLGKGIGDLVEDRAANAAGNAYQDAIHLGDATRSLGQAADDYLSGGGVDEFY